MGLHRVLALIVLAGLAGAAFGCAETEPYVHNAVEFDRDAPEFAKEPADIATIEICYSRLSTTAQALRELADARCGEFGKVARFRSQGYGKCPLLTPAGAVFACVKE